MISSSEIDYFLADRTVQSAIEASRETRPLRICYPKEIPVTRFLAWLLDPSQGHGLNGNTLKSLLMACWNNLDSAEVTIAARNRITPSILYSESFAGALVQREVRLGTGQHALDILVLLPEQNLLIAIENKFGANQGINQLNGYRKSLQKQYEGYHQILVYLDLYDSVPADSHWIGLDYSWLVEELEVAESSSWLGEAPRRALREFRHVIDSSADDYGLPGVKETQLLEMVRNHESVFRQFAKWKSARSTKSEQMASLYGRRVTKDTRALQQLFPIYCQRTELWHQCIPMLAYASLRERAELRFKEQLHCQPKRTTFYFSLKKWLGFAHSDDGWCPVQVMVREQQNPARDDQKYVIESFIRFDNVSEKFENEFMAIAKNLRERNLKRKQQIATGQNRVPVHLDFASDRAEAADKLVDHLEEIEQALSALITRI